MGTRSAGELDEQGGRLHPRYFVEERLGGGGITEVFRATLLGVEGFARPVAIKLIRSEFRHDERIIERFSQEARALGRLCCYLNIVSAQNFERGNDGQLFQVLEFVDGMDLRRLIASGPLPPAVAIFIACEVLRGLRHAHKILSEHGDVDVVRAGLSSHNILLSWSGAVKVASSSCASASLELPGMSSEQAVSPDGRSDLFSVGVMLWEMLTGERLVDDPIRRPGLIRPVRADLEAVAMTLLERDPDRCWRDAEAAFDALLACEDASPLGPLELEWLLQDRFPREAPRRLRSPRTPARRARPPMGLLPGPPMARLCSGPRRPSPPPRSGTASLGRWWRPLALTACVAVGAFLGVVGGFAFAGTWRSGSELDRVIAAMRGSTSEGRKAIGERLTCHTPESSAGSTPAAGTGGAPTLSVATSMGR